MAKLLVTKTPISETITPEVEAPADILSGQQLRIRSDLIRNGRVLPYAEILRDICGTARNSDQQRNLDALLERYRCQPANDLEETDLLHELSLDLKSLIGFDRLVGLLLQVSRRGHLPTRWRLWRHVSDAQEQDLIVLAQELLAAPPQQLLHVPRETLRSPPWIQGPLAAAICLEARLGRDERHELLLQAHRVLGRLDPKHPNFRLVSAGIDELQDTLQTRSLQVMRQKPIIKGAPEESAQQEHLAAILTRPLPLRGLDVDVRKLRAELLAEFPWFAPMIRWVSDSLAARQADGNAPGWRPMLLSGAPGIGKTQFASRLGAATGRPVVYLNLAGESSARLLVGTARGWSSARPGLIVQRIAEFKIANPIVVIDELDKEGTSDANGRNEQALLGLLDPNTARVAVDPFLTVPLDLSEISWVLLVNDLQRLNAPLRSRCQQFSLDGPGLNDLPTLIHNCLRRSRNPVVSSTSLVPPDLTQSEWDWAMTMAIPPGRSAVSARKVAAVVERILNARTVAQRVPARLH